MAQLDPKLRSYVHGRRLAYLGSGVGSVVFAAGIDRVVRVTAMRDECELMERIVGRGAVVGWPRVYATFWVPDEFRASWDRRCVAVVERVRVGDDIPNRMWSDFVDALTLVALIHRRRGRPGRRSGLGWSPEWPEYTDSLDVTRRTYDWATQLYKGAKVSNSWSSSELDVHHRNAGITRDGEAVWVDFGV